MEAVADGKADCTFLNYYQASYFRSQSRFESFNYQPVDTITQGIGLGITKESNPLLLSILSKSLQRIKQNQLQNILNKDTAVTEPFSLQTMIKRYPLPMASAILIFAVLICLLVFLLVTSRTRKRQNLALAEAKNEAEVANRAKSDFLSRMSKAESGKIELRPEPYPADEFGNYVNAIITPLCQERSQTFRFEPVEMLTDVIPLFDKLRINQIVFNLLSNAVKYTPEGGRIRYRIFEKRLSDRRMRCQYSRHWR